MVGSECCAWSEYLCLHLRKTRYAMLQSAHSLDISLSISTTHMCTHVQVDNFPHLSNLSGQSYQMYHTTVHQYVCMAEGVLLVIGGAEDNYGYQTTLLYMASIMMIRSGSTLETYHLNVPLWTHCQEEGC